MFNFAFNKRKQQESILQLARPEPLSANKTTPKNLLAAEKELKPLKN